MGDDIARLSSGCGLAVVVNDNDAAFAIASVLLACVSISSANNTVFAGGGDFVVLLISLGAGTLTLATVAPLAFAVGDLVVVGALGGDLSATAALAVGNTAGPGCGPEAIGALGVTGPFVFGCIFGIGCAFTAGAASVVGSSLITLV